MHVLCRHVILSLSLLCLLYILHSPFFSSVSHPPSSVFFSCICKSIKMSTASSSTGGSNGCKGCWWLRLAYEYCWCRERASIKIVADPRRETYGMLYFVCENKGKMGGCHFFQWCFPKVDDSGLQSPKATEEMDGVIRNRREVASKNGFLAVLVACAALFFAFLSFLIVLAK